MWGCRRVRKQLALYVGGELTATEQEAVEAHVRRCPGCRQELQRLRAARDQLLQLATCDTGLPWPSVLPEVRARIRDLPQGASSRRWFRFLPYLAVGAATLVALAGWMTLGRRPATHNTAPQEHAAELEHPGEALLFTTFHVEQAAPAPYASPSTGRFSYHLDWASPQPVYSGSVADN